MSEIVISFCAGFIAYPITVKYIMPYVADKYLKGKYNKKETASCPECGSTRRHYKNCSKHKAKAKPV